MGGEPLRRRGCSPHALHSKAWMRGTLGRAAQGVPRGSACVAADGPHTPPDGSLKYRKLGEGKLLASFPSPLEKARGIAAEMRRTAKECEEARTAASRRTSAFEMVLSPQRPLKECCFLLWKKFRCLSVAVGLYFGLIDFHAECVGENRLKRPRLPCSVGGSPAPHSPGTVRLFVVSLLPPARICRERQSPPRCRMAAIP